LQHETGTGSGSVWTRSIKWFNQ